MTTQCFWVEPTDLAELSLRRYWASRDHTVKPCPASPYGYCNEEVVIGRSAVRRDAEGFLEFIRPAEFAADPRWPQRCSHCGREFGPIGDGVSRFEDCVNDQVNQEPIYRARDGREWPMRRLPPGAMFDAPWARGFGVGADGISLTVVTPYRGEDGRHGFWRPDGRATNSDRPWDRTGDPRADPPTVTCTPSILTSDYHGFLTNGVLTDDIGGHS